jgi:hypothetical protein
MKEEVTALPVWLQEKWQRIKDGSREIMSDQSLDMLCEHFKDSDSEEADLFFSRLKSVPNPHMVGTLGKYEVWM